MAVYVPVVTPGVTAQNSAANATADDVIGNKADTTAGTSLVSMDLNTRALLNSPAGDSALNTTVVEVLGDKSDTIAGDSALALAKRVVHGPGRIYCLPVAAAGTALAGGAGAWANPANWTQVVAASPAADTAIVGIQIDTPSGAMVGEIDVGLGAGDPAHAEVTIPFVVVSDAGYYLPICCPRSGRVTAATRIAARLRTAAGGAQTLNVKVLFQAIGD